MTLECSYDAGQQIQLRYATEWLDSGQSAFLDRSLKLPISCWSFFLFTSETRHGLGLMGLRHMANEINGISKSRSWLVHIDPPLQKPGTHVQHLAFQGLSFSLLLFDFQASFIA